MKEKWWLAGLIGIVMGLVLWGLSFSELEIKPGSPLFLWVWSPVILTGALTYFDLIRRQWRGWKYWGLVWIVTTLAMYLPNWLPTLPSNQYQNLLLIHLPLLAWVGMGGYVLGRKANYQAKWAFLALSLEVMVTVGMMMVVAAIFMGTTQMLFGTMDILIPEPVIRLVITCGLGIGSMIAIVINYKQELPIEKQNFTGIYPLIAMLARIFVPLVLAVLLVYLIVIPFNFWMPFEKREVLVTFNGVLIAVIGLLVAATPVLKELGVKPWGKWLRWGMMTVAGLILIITLYALSAALYRTAMDRWTINRAAVMGWNIINGVVLAVLLGKQIKAGGQWVEALQKTWAKAMVGWAVWIIGLVAILPWFFL